MVDIIARGMSASKNNTPGNYTHPETHPASMITGLSTVATSGNYSDLLGIPTIPTKTSQLINDSNYLQNVPLATDSTVGGVKALPKTEDYTGEVRIDLNTGKLYVLPSSGSGGGNVTMSQVSKMGVVASTSSPKAISIDVNTTDFNVPQVNILKFDNTNTENKMVIKADFTNGEANDFMVDPYVLYNGKAQLKTSYDYNMTRTENSTYDEWSVDIDTTSFKASISISNDLDLNVLTLSAIPTDRIMVPIGDLNISNVQHLDYFNIIGTGNNIRVICSIDSGGTWKTYKNNQWLTTQLTVNSMKADGMSISTINAIDEYGWSMLNHKDTIRFAYMLSMDNLSDTEEIDDLIIQYDSVGKWVQLKEADYDVYYEGNRTLIVTLKTGGDIKINY